MVHKFPVKINCIACIYLFIEEFTLARKNTTLLNSAYSFFCYHPKVPENRFRPRLTFSFDLEHLKCWDRLLKNVCYIFTFLLNNAN